MFQFALPRGERLDVLNDANPELGFNSRSRVGSDKLYRFTNASTLEFQFALPRGERLPSPDDRYGLA